MIKIDDTQANLDISYLETQASSMKSSSKVKTGGTPSGTVPDEKRKFSLDKCSFSYDPQVFSAYYDQVLVPVPANSTLNLKTSIVQYNVEAEFVASFYLIQPASDIKTKESGVDDPRSLPKLSQLQIKGTLHLIEHKFESEIDRRYDCRACCDTCTIF